MNIFVKLKQFSCLNKVQSGFSVIANRLDSTLTSVVNGKFTGYIPLDKLKVTYSQSSGPGGQNVNNVETKVDVRFRIESADWLTPEIQNYLLKEKKHQINKDGYLIFRSDITRYRHLNLANVLEKLRTYLREACDALHATPKEPTPEKKIEIANRIINANVNRLKYKRYRSMAKSLTSQA